MLSLEQEEFYTRWRAKADALAIDSIENCIDKYVTLFIIYNALYNIVPEKVARHTGNRAGNIGDKRFATSNILSFLGSANILHVISPQDIGDLHTILQQRLFNIKFNIQGVHQPSADRQLASDLLSANADTKTLAVLETLYYIRCNIVHGRKGLAPYQTLVVQPVINLIQPIINLLYQELRHYPV